LAAAVAAMGAGATSAGGGGFRARIDHYLYSGEKKHVLAGIAIFGAIFGVPWYFMTRGTKTTLLLHHEALSTFPFLCLLEFLRVLCYRQIALCGADSGDLGFGAFERSTIYAFLGAFLIVGVDLRVKGLSSEIVVAFGNRLRGSNHELFGA
jgi:hypothetical protein